MTDIISKIELLHLCGNEGGIIQKNYDSEPVHCDKCGLIPKYLMLEGGYSRACLNCHFRNCDKCRIKVIDIKQSDIETDLSEGSAYRDPKHPYARENYKKDE